MVDTNRLVVLALAAVVLVAVAAGAGAVSFTDETGAQYHPDRDVQLVETSNGTALWPYTSRARAFPSKTLSINVVVYGDAADVRHALVARTDADWNETASDQSDLDPDAAPPGPNGTAVAWESARGATRYTYVANVAREDGTPAGYWMAESGQFHDGDYLGSRYHVRLYEPIDDEERWVAMQAHQEHWDWFGLRHSVDSNERAQQYVEADFMGQPFVDSVSREYYATSDPLDTDGWVTEIELRGGAVRLPNATEGEADASENSTADGALATAAVPATAQLLVGVPLAALPGVGVPQVGGILALAALAAGLVGALTASAPVSPDRISRTLSRSRERLVAVAADVDLRYLVLFGATLSVLLFVRTTGIYLEQVLPGSPKLVVALCYPLVPVGVPLVAYLPARGLDEFRCFVVASTGVALGITVDYALLGVAVLPVETLVHRLGVVLAVGLLAAGAAEKGQSLRLGALLWVAVVFAPLVRWF
ncbi:hypothetical protein [Natronoarchaeum mannanilyticum]|uniref:hypothetical protein n=1 Tax=Natronoarchaeum mannanilyticum TaxID=926360 RepID=UPI0031DB3108